MSFKMAFRVPSWLLNIPAGDYSIHELVVLTKTSHANIFMRLDALKVEKTYKRLGRTWKNIYHWKGAFYYISQAYEHELTLMNNEQKKA